MESKRNIRSLALACLGADVRYPDAIEDSNGLKVTIINVDDLHKKQDARRAFENAITPSVVLDLLDEIEDLKTRLNMR